ncbi:MAG: AMP-binding protein, partial [Actinomycetia bacterium]|nr:AMP-binding protein [Actinomycetes bacterium]
MNTDTPQSWLERGAQSDPHAAALVMADGAVSYGDLAAQVHQRVRSLRHEVDTGVLVPVPVRLDMPSIVEMLAVMKIGGVVVPYGAHRPRLDGHPPRGAAVCLPTSGTRGRPQMVPLSYDNIAASVAASRTRLGNGPQDRWLATLPLTHVGGLSVLWRSLEAGGAVIVAPFDELLPDVLEGTLPTFASLVPTMLYRLMKSAPDELSRIGTVLIGGA